MKGSSALGLGALLCAPCLLVALVAGGGALALFVRAPALWAGGLLVVAAAGAFLAWRWWQRRCCEIDASASGATSTREAAIPRRTDRGA